MRFFQGTRGGDKKKVSPSELYKQKMSGKVVQEKTMAEKYQDMIEAKMQKMMEDVILGRKKARPKIPGTKSVEEDDGPPPEISKNAKLMLKMLAMQKIKKDQKKEKKKALAEMWSMKSKKKAEAMAKAAKEAAEYQKQQDDANAAAAAAAEAAAAHNSWNSGWGTTSSDDKGGGWW